MADLSAPIDELPVDEVPPEDRAHDDAPIPSRPAELLRFDRAERWLHWTNATLVLVLIATGSCMYIGWLSGLVGHREQIRVLHVWTGILVPIPFLILATGPWGAGFRADCRRLGRFLTVDWRWLRRRERRYGQLYVGKFNAGQKLNAILVAGALPVLFGTGLLLHWARDLPDSWRTGATFVHDWGYVALSLLVLGHILKALADPISLRSMRTGRVPASWARDERPRWYDEQTPYDGGRSEEP